MLLRRLSGEASLRDTLGRQGKSYVEATYSLEKAARETTELLSELRAGGWR